MLQGLKKMYGKRYRHLLATCVSMTFQVATDLYASLAKIPGRPALLNTVQSLRHDKVRYRQGRVSIHCLAGSFLETNCIVVDLVFSAKAFKVPYNGSSETVPYIPLSGRPQGRMFHHVAGSCCAKIFDHGAGG